MKYMVVYIYGHGFKWHGGGPEPISIMDGGVLDFIYNFTFIPALAHRHATGSSGDLFFKSARQLLGRKSRPDLSPFRPHVASPGSWGVGGDLWLMAESNFNEDITNINQQ